MAVTIVVEDGTNVTGANSYISLADAKTYFNNRGDQTFDALTPDKMGACLVRGASAMDYWLNGRWRGRRANQIQALDWPRIGMIDSDGYCVPKNTIPQKLKNAQCEIAKIESSTPFIQTQVSNQNTLKLQAIGPIKSEFMDTSPSISYWPMIIAMLKDYAQIGVMPIEVVIGITERERKLRGEDHHGFGLNPFDFPDYFHLEKEAIYNPGGDWYDSGWLL
jgi:hypothetical protein